MKNILILCLLFCLVSVKLMAQQNTKFYIKGTLKDSNQVPISLATIHILSSTDSTSVAVNITDKKGNFKVTGLPTGAYILSATHLLYKQKLFPIHISRNTVLDPIIMDGGINKLGGITITANTIQYKADRYIIHLQGNSITKGNNTTQVLGLLPGVTNVQGNLKINGQKVSQIYLDGHKLRDRKELDAIQAANIDKVEILPMSGSDEDASGAGGIIYIKLKKTPLDGFYGSSSANFTILSKDGHQSDNINTSFNYRHKNLSIYDYIAYGDFKNVDKYNVISFYKNSNQTVNMKTNGSGWTHSFSDRLSLTYEINKSHSIGGNFRIGVTNGMPIQNSESMAQNNNGNPISRSGSNINNKLRNQQYQSSFNYDWLIDKKGSTFKFILDYLRYNDDSKQNNTDWYTPLADKQKSSAFSSNNIDNKTDMLEADAKLNFRVSNSSQLDAGLNYSLNNSRQLLNYQNLRNGIWIPDTKLSDNYKLNGKNYAGYTSYSSLIGKKLMYKVGIRVQENEIAYNSVKINQHSSKNYWGIYPTVNLMYAINQRKGTMVNFAYQRAMKPIPYNLISPVVVYNSEYNYTKGNTNIKPENLNIIMLGTTINGQWNISAMFMTGKGILYFKTFQDKENPLITYTMPINGATRTSYMLAVDRSFKISKWWRLKANIQLGKDKYSGEINRSSFRSHFTMTNNLNFKNGWGGNISAYLEPAFKSEERTYKSVYGFSGDIYKYLLKNKLMLNLNFTAYAHNRTLITDTPDIYTERYNKTNSTRFTIGVTYNFNGGKKIKTKQAKSIQSYYKKNDN